MRQPEAIEAFARALESDGSIRTRGPGVDSKRATTLYLLEAWCLERQVAVLCTELKQHMAGDSGTNSDPSQVLFEAWEKYFQTHHGLSVRIRPAWLTKGPSTPESPGYIMVDTKSDANVRQH